MTKLVWITSNVGLIAGALAERLDEHKIREIADASLKIAEHLADDMVKKEYLTHA